MTAATPYDAVAYPSATFRQTHPDRLSVIARLHGLAAPSAATARVLEIGGGDGFNMLALAAAWPEAQFFSFDLSGEAVARGRALIEATGLSNIRIEQADILDVVASVKPGSYDYVVAHGVYAWVPAPVREAIMALAGHVLAPDGVFFLSYNALPGGHIRQIMRDMLLHALQDVIGIEDRIRAARVFLEDHKQPRPDDYDVITAIRMQSEAMLKRPDAVLFHDELGDCFAPQYLSDVVDAAAAHGLDYLNDSGANHLADGFAGEDESAEPDMRTLVRRAQARDFEEMRFFRQSLFVRAGRSPARRPRLGAIADMFAGGEFERSEEGGVKARGTEFVLRDKGMMERLIALGSLWPAYQPVSAIAQDEEQCEALFRLLKIGAIFLSAQPPPFSPGVSDRPVASALVRAQLLADTPEVTSLSFETVRIADPAARAFIPLLDGTRDVAALAPVWQDLPHDPALSVERALEMLAGQRLMLA